MVLGCRDPYFIGGGPYSSVPDGGLPYSNVLDGSTVPLTPLDRQCLFGTLVSS